MVDPYNLENLLCLGISCTNQAEKDEALLHLKAWISANPDYSNLEVPASTDLR